MTGSVHDRDDLSQEAKDDLVARAVDEAIAGLRALADLTDVSLRSAADTAVWASRAFEVVDLTVDLTVTIRSAEDPVQYVRNAMSFRDERGNSVTVVDVFRNDE